MARDGHPAAAVSGSEAHAAARGDTGQAACATAAGPTGGRCFECARMRCVRRDPGCVPAGCGSVQRGFGGVGELTRPGRGAGRRNARLGTRLPRVAGRLNTHSTPAHASAAAAASWPPHVSRACMARSPCAIAARSLAPAASLASTPAGARVSRADPGRAADPAAAFEDGLQAGVAEAGRVEGEGEGSGLGLAAERLADVSAACRLRDVATSNDDDNLSQMTRGNNRNRKAKHSQRRQLR